MRNVNSDVAYEHIRKKILNGDYAPGSALMTNVLSEEIGVSRTPVRDALRQLEADGLVSIQPRLGASVKAMDMKELREMCDMRLALESHAAGLAAQHRTDEELQEMRYALEAMRRLTEAIVGSAEEKRVFGDLVREDVRFHIAIMTAAKNDLMKKEILRLHLINRVVSGSNPFGDSEQTEGKKALDGRNERRRIVLASHTEIYEAIERRDVAAAKVAMERHIQDIVEHHLKTLGSKAEGGYVARELTPEEMLYTV